jgi:hypothetical protein
MSAKKNLNLIDHLTAQHICDRSNKPCNQFNSPLIGLHNSTTLNIPISACYYLKLHNAMMSEHPIELSLVKIELLSKTLSHCVTQDSNMH